MKKNEKNIHNDIYHSINTDINNLAIYIYSSYRLK